MGLRRNVRDAVLRKLYIIPYHLEYRMWEGEETYTCSSHGHIFQSTPTKQTKFLHDIRKSQSSPGGFDL
jgi:hypothetical protein